MNLIVLASQVKIGDSIRLNLKSRSFTSDHKWHEHCARTLHVIGIGPSHTEGKLEFNFDEKSGSYCDIDPDTEVILVNRPAEYVYSYGINPTDPRDSYGGGDGTVTANSDEEAIEKIYKKHGRPPFITIDWVYAINHEVNLNLKGEKE